MAETCLIAEYLRYDTRGTIVFPKVYFCLPGGGHSRAEIQETMQYPLHSNTRPHAGPDFEDYSWPTSRFRILAFNRAARPVKMKKKIEIFRTLHGPKRRSRRTSSNIGAASRGCAPLSASAGRTRSLPESLAFWEGVGVPRLEFELLRRLSRLLERV